MLSGNEISVHNIELAPISTPDSNDIFFMKSNFNL